MARLKGTPKSGGRQKGTQNVVTKELRERIKDFLEGNMDSIISDFKALTPLEKLQTFEKYLRFVVPALASSSMDLSVSKMSDTQVDELLQSLVKK